jgi:hypothetical protein
VPARFALQFNVVLRLRIWHTRRPMNDDAVQQKTLEPASPVHATSLPEARPATTRPREIGGREGPEPTRFGDWEKNGRCIDF